MLYHSVMKALSIFALSAVSLFGQTDLIIERETVLSSPLTGRNLDMATACPKGQNIDEACWLAHYDRPVWTHPFALDDGADRRVYLTATVSVERSGFPAYEMTMRRRVLPAHFSGRLAAYGDAVQFQVTPLFGFQFWFSRMPPGGHYCRDDLQFCADRFVMDFWDYSRDTGGFQTKVVLKSLKLQGVLAE